MVQNHVINMTLYLLMLIKLGYSSILLLVIYHCRGEQVHVMCTMEEFLPSIGMSIPSPSALAILLSQSDSTMQTITKLHPDGTSSVDFDNPFDFYDESLLVSKTTFISLSDDGKIWKWVLSAEGVEDALKNVSDLDIGTEAARPEAIEKKDSSDLDEGLVVAATSRSRGHTSTSSLGKSDLSFKVGGWKVLCVN